MTQLNQLAQLSAERMLNCMLEGIAIGLFAWILLRVTGRRNSSTRFAVWFSALVAIAALPVLSAVSGSAPAGSSAITDPRLLGARHPFYMGGNCRRVAAPRRRRPCAVAEPAGKLAPQSIQPRLDPLLQARCKNFKA